MRKFFLTLSALFFLLINTQAQNRTITGKVTDENGQGIQGVSVLVKGTRIGTETNADGNFSLSVPASARTLVISSVNMETQETAISGESVNVTLKTSTTSLEGVVITSLGIARDKRSLGYASQNLKGEELANRGEVNIVNALQGKVAGVNITSASGGAGASVNINIRGVSSFTGSNQPLFVIDGIPISNDVDRTNGGPNGTLGDNQPANRALDIDMNNVESVNILKGLQLQLYMVQEHQQELLLLLQKKVAVQEVKLRLYLIQILVFKMLLVCPKFKTFMDKEPMEYLAQPQIIHWGQNLVLPQV